MLMLLVQSKHKGQWNRTEDLEIMHSDTCLIFDKIKKCQHTLEKRQPLQQTGLRKFNSYITHKGDYFSPYKNIKIDQRPGEDIRICKNFLKITPIANHHKN